MRQAHEQRAAPRSRSRSRSRPALALGLGPCVADAATRRVRGPSASPHARAVLPWLLGWAPVELLAVGAAIQSRLCYIPFWVEPSHLNPSKCLPTHPHLVHTPSPRRLSARTCTARHIAVGFVTSAEQPQDSWSAWFLARSHLPAMRSSHIYHLFHPQHIFTSACISTPKATEAFH